MKKDLEELTLASKALKNDSQWNSECEKDMIKELLQTNKDINGREIKIGDYIVFSTSIDEDSSQLCFGKVVSVSHSDSFIHCITVRSYIDKNKVLTWKLACDGSPVRMRFFGTNLFIINPEQIPNNAFQLLLCAHATLKPE